MKTWLVALTLLSVVMGFSSVVLAIPVHSQTLFDRGNGMIYDSAQNLTWLRDANYAKTTGYTNKTAFERWYFGYEYGDRYLTDEQWVALQPLYADWYKEAKQDPIYNLLTGTMNWVAAMRWADTLVYGGYDDWRLPTTPSTDLSCETNVQERCGGELGYLTRVELGNTGGNRSINTGPFKNVQMLDYWTSSYLLGETVGGGYDFYFTVFVNGGGEGHIVDYPVWNAYAWAVRDGDVRHSHSVPEPSTLILLGVGLAGVVTWRRMFTSTQSIN